MKWINVKVLIIYCLMMMHCNSKMCDLEFCENTSNIFFPNEYKIVECIDNYEYLITGKIIIQKVDIENFLTTNFFVKSKNGSIPNLEGAKWLSEQNSEISKGVLYYSKGSRKENSWVYVIDSVNGNVWFEVLYPDWAGNPNITNDKDSISDE